MHTVFTKSRLTSYITSSVLRVLVPRIQCDCVFYNIHPYGTKSTVFSPHRAFTIACLKEYCCMAQSSRRLLFHRLYNCLKVMLQGPAHCPNFKSLLRLREFTTISTTNEHQKVFEVRLTVQCHSVDCHSIERFCATSPKQTFGNGQTSTNNTYLVELQTIRENTPHIS